MAFSPLLALALPPTFPLCLPLAFAPMFESQLAPGLCPYIWLGLQGRAYQYGLETLRQQGVPVEGLTFDPELVSRGLIMDKDNGNLIKVWTAWGVGDL